MDYDRLYSGKHFYWWLEADWIVHHCIDNYFKNKKKELEVLDLWCGEGRNSFALTQVSKNITAIDISLPWINKLHSFAQRNDLKITSIHAEALSFLSTSKSYDVIFALNLLQSLDEKKVNNIIEKMKQKTSKKGYNIITSFIAKNSKEYLKAKKRGNYLFQKEEMRERYKEWTILFYNEMEVMWNHDTETRIILEIIAQNHEQ